MSNYFDRTIANQVLTEGFKASEIDKVTPFLKRIDVYLREKLSGDDLTEYGRTRVEKLLKVIDDELSLYFDSYTDELKSDLVDFSEFEAELEKESIDSLFFDADFETVLPTSSQLKAAVFSAPLSVRGANGGKLLEPFINDWSTAEKDKLIGAIRQGFFEGQTNAQIIKNIRGTKAGNYSDGLLAVSARNANSIVRTSVQHVASTARVETLTAQGDLVDSYEWVSTLDSRTTIQCQALDGQIFKMGKGPLPPIHIGCRSTFVPVLNEKYSFLNEGMTRASQDGPVDSKMSYYDWLKTQPPAFQKELLGTTRYELFNVEGMTSAKFADLNLNRNFQPLTLDEMRAKAPKLFDKIE